MIDAVSDDRIRPDWSFLEGSWRGLVPCFAIRGHELLKQSITGIGEYQNPWGQTARPSSV